MAATGAVGPIVSCEWLKDNLQNDQVKILDASWFLPVMGRNAVQEFKAARIPGSAFFDIDGVADTSQPFPHMLPTAAAFAAAADALSVQADSIVVLYDRVGTFSSPRAWWTWKVFGHNKVAILNGGFPAWTQRGYAVDGSDIPDDEVHRASTAAKAPPGRAAYAAQLDAAQVKGIADVREALRSGSAQVVDARSRGRFRGLEPEPRAEVPSGHMPGALNVPFMTLLDGDAPSGAYKSPEQLRAAFEAAGVDLSKPIICTCGSGSTAAVLVHALHQLGTPMTPIYDASWMEWATHPESEIVSEVQQQ